MCLLAACLALQDGAGAAARAALEPLEGLVNEGNLHTAGLYAALVLYEGRLSGSRGRRFPNC